MKEPGIETWTISTDIELRNNRFSDPLDLVCCPPGECEHAACEARYLKRLGLRRYPKDPLEDRWPE